MRSHSPVLASLLVSAAITACAASSPPEGLAPTTVRERLSAATPTKLLVTAPASSGTLTASRYTHDGWQDGTIAIALANGELDASAAPDGDGRLEIHGFSVNVDPIEIPASVLGKPAELRDLRLVLAGAGAPAPMVTTTWVDDDDAIATAMLSLDLSWTIVVDGAAAPLGTQHLAPLPFDVALTGTGEQIDSAIALHASGELWSWAGLVKLTELDLQLAATTAY